MAAREPGTDILYLRFSFDKIEKERDKGLNEPNKSRITTHPAVRGSERLRGTKYVPINTAKIN